MSSVNRKEIYFLLLLLLLTVAFRLPGLNKPVGGLQYWREAETAAMTRNFATEDMNILHPRIDWRGQSSGLVESEFPLYAYISAFSYKVFGFSETWPRILNILTAMITVCLLFLLLKGFLTLEAAMIAASFLSLSPLFTYYSRTIMPDAMMLMFLTAAIFFFNNFARRGGFIHGLLSFISLSTCLSMKISSLPLILPIMALSLHSKRKNTVLILCLLSLLPPLLWYKHALSLYWQTGLSFGIFGAKSFNKFQIFQELLSFKWWLTVIPRIYFRLLSPIGITFAFLGIIINHLTIKDFKQKKLPAFFTIWLLAALSHLIIIARGNRILDYYQLFTIPPLACFAGYSSDLIIRKITNDKKNKILLTLFILFISSAITIISLLENTRTRSFQADIINFAAKISALSEPDDLFIVIDSKLNDNNKWLKEMVPRIHSPFMLYQIQRKGFELLPDELAAMNPAQFNSMIKQGASYMIIPKEIFNSYKGISNFLLENYKPAFHDQKFILFSLEN